MLHLNNYNKVIKYQLQHELRLVEYKLTLLQTRKNLLHALHMEMKYSYVNPLLIHLTIRKTGYTSNGVEKRIFNS